MVFYKPQIIKWIDKMFKNSEYRHWYSTYWLFDLHGVISRPDYRKCKHTDENGKCLSYEKHIDYYPYSKETLQLLSKRNDIVMILFTSSYPEEIEFYVKEMERDNIHFKYINENPEISEKNGCFGYYERKPYYNVLIDDKTGFCSEKDWKYIYKYFLKTKYRPNPQWTFKNNEEYHVKEK